MSIDSKYSPIGAVQSSRQARFSDVVVYDKCYYVTFPAFILQFSIAPRQNTLFNTVSTILTRRDLKLRHYRLSESVRHVLNKNY